MVDTEYNFLRLVEYKEFNIWTVKNYLGEKVTSKFNVEHLGKHIVNQTKKIKLFDYPNETFGILGISNEVGMFDAYFEKGENINQAYKIVENEYLAYNPYRVNVGSIGIKNSDLKNNFISPAYVVFKCKETLLPQFLYILMRSSIFNSITKNSTTGSVRQTLGFDVLSNIKIPIPPVEVQQLLINKYYTTVLSAEKKEAEVSELERGIDKLLFHELGIQNQVSDSKNSNSKSTYIEFVDYKDLDVWSVEYLIKKGSCDFIYSGKYRVIPAKKFIKSFQYGLSEKASEIPIGMPMLRMNNIVNSELVLNKLKYLNIDKSLLEKYILNKGDLLFNRTNSKELVGKTTIFNLETEHTFASYLIRVVLDENIVDPQYINILFNSVIVRSQINLISRQVLGQANINSSEMQLLKFPLPDLEIQIEIRKKIEKIKLKIKNLRSQIQELRTKAKQDFENAIFNN